jgi:hypothetical protein
MVVKSLVVPSVVRHFSICSTTFGQAGRPVLADSV